VAVGRTRLLAELRRHDAAEFGGKSANLGELLAAEIPVPTGFAIEAGAYRAFVEEAGLDGMIAAALTRGDEQAAKTIDEAMRFAPLPAELREELEQRYAALGAGSVAGGAGDARPEDWAGNVAGGAGDARPEDWEPPVAVRSSALGEDSQDATYAGQQETFLWIRGIEHLCDAVRDCWVSLYTPRAIAYRANLGVTQAAMGVTVQVMIDAVVSGVMFTCNPVSGDPSMVAVNASWGLGLAVVGGETNPDDYLVSKVTREVVRSTVNSKEIEYVVAPDGRGTVRVEVPAERRDAACLGGEELAAFVELARRVEGHFGCHQDVEWAIERGSRKLHALQARPVTATRAAPQVSGSAIALVMNTFGAGDRP
jgi:pyruvate, water dikinase